MGLMYSAVFQAVAVTAAQDLLSLLTTSACPIRLHYFSCGQGTDVGDAAEEILRIRIQRGMTTVGSGGSAPAAVPLIRGGRAATATPRANDTTAASGGTIEQVWEENWNVRTQYIWMPTPEMRPDCDVSMRIAFNLVGAPADSLTLSGTIVWEELR
jgi:hypothetical protein